MKNKVTITALIMILVTGISSLDLHAQRSRGMRGIRKDSTIVRFDSLNKPMAGRRMAMMNHQMMNGRMGNYDGRMPMRGRSDGRMASGFMYQGMRHPFYGYNQAGPGMAYGRMGEALNNVPGRRIMESLPGVTAKQKEDLAALNKQQQEEMQKLREKHLEAIKELRNNHKKKVEGLLTDEQKKWLEENTPAGR